MNGQNMIGAFTLLTSLLALLTWTPPVLELFTATRRHYMLLLSRLVHGNGTLMASSSMAPSKSEPSNSNSDNTPKQEI
jgi:hypothetical protein